MEGYGDLDNGVRPEMLESEKLEEPQASRYNPTKIDCCGADTSVREDIHRRFIVPAHHNQAKFGTH